MTRESGPGPRSETATAKSTGEVSSTPIMPRPADDADVVQVRGGPAFQLTPDITSALSGPGSKRGRLQRACLAVLLEHRDDGSLPTSMRFLFYELAQRGAVSKARSNERGRRPDQDMNDALTSLRDSGIVPWDWVVDETRADALGRAGWST